MSEGYKINYASAFATLPANLGNMLQNGLGVAQDLAEALKWYSRAAAQGHTGAMVTLDEREKEEAARKDARSRFNLGMQVRGFSAVETFHRAMKRLLDYTESWRRMDMVKLISAWAACMRKV
jgi:TPR repeat protein